MVPFVPFDAITGLSIQTAPGTHAVLTDNGADDTIPVANFAIFWRVLVPSQAAHPILIVWFEPFRPYNPHTAMSEAEQLRLEAARALRLSEQILDRQAKEALVAHAAKLLERAEALERDNTRPVPSPQAPCEQPAQQQQQPQP